MKTVIEQLIDRAIFCKTITTTGYIDYDSLIKELTLFKELEKSQITTAFNVGFKDSGLSFLNGENYFDSAFGDSNEAGI